MTTIFSTSSTVRMPLCAHSWRAWPAIRDGNAPPAVLHLDLQQHQNDFFRQFEHLNPVVDEVDFLRLKRPFENPLSFFKELLIVQLVPRFPPVSASAVSN